MDVLLLLVAHVTERFTKSLPSSGHMHHNITCSDLHNMVEQNMTNTILSLFNPVQITTLYFFNIHFHIFILSSRVSPSFSIRILQEFHRACVPHLVNSFYISHPTHPSSVHRNILGAAQIILVLMTCAFPLPCYTFLLRSKYFQRHSLLKHQDDVSHTCRAERTPL
jgi:hypothetical protein